MMLVVLAAATLSIVDRSARWLLALRPLPGIAWAALLVLPWFVAISMRVGSAFLIDSVGHDTLGKIGECATEPRGAARLLPRAVLRDFFSRLDPDAGLAAPAVAASAMRREPAVRFLLAWLVPSWIMFELAVTKLPHYVLPLYPAIAILFAVPSSETCCRTGAGSCAASYGGSSSRSSSASLSSRARSLSSHEPVLAAWPFLAAAIVCGLLAWRLYKDERRRAGARVRHGGLDADRGRSLRGFIIPALGPLFPSLALAGVLRGSDCAQPIAASRRIRRAEPCLPRGDLDPAH